MNKKIERNNLSKRQNKHLFKCKKEQHYKWEKKSRSKRKWKSQSDNKYAFICFLNKLTDGESLRDDGREFQSFGPWKNIVDWRFFLFCSVPYANYCTV